MTAFAAPVALQLKFSRLVCSVTPIASARRMPAVVRPLVPSPQLRRFVPDRAQPRSEILKILSQYVKENGLQDPDNKTLVVCDEPLRKLFGVDTCTFLGMSKYISPHLSKPEDIGGKYIEEARRYEEKWFAENADKPASTRRRASRKRADSSGEARAKGTGVWTPVQLSPELAKVCGKQELPRQQIIKAVWDYIREKNLQPAPGKPITCDAALRAVFNSDTLTARQIMGGITPHVIKKQK